MLRARIGCFALGILAGLLFGRAEAATRPAQDSVPADEIECRAQWGPVESSVYPLVRQDPSVRRALSSGPSEPRRRHPVEVFRALLPDGPAPSGVTEDPEVAVSPEVWEIEVEKLLPFLHQLHPGATPRMRHAHLPERTLEYYRQQGMDPPEWTPRSVEGGRATWIRRDAARWELLLRVHLEFELIPDELWFLPAQFEGHLVWDPVAERPLRFHLALPPRNTNYDLCHVSSVDIGYLPLMQVATVGASAAGAEADAARARLRAAFYECAKVRWRPLAEALRRATENGGRLHVVQLFGTLDDESC